MCLSFLSLPVLYCPCSAYSLTVPSRFSTSLPHCRLPARPSEDYKRRGQDFKGGLHSANGDGLGGVGGVAQTAAQVLKHLPMKHGRLCLTSDLMQSARDTTGRTQQRERYAHTWDKNRGEESQEEESQNELSEEKEERVEKEGELMQRKGLVQKTKWILEHIHTLSVNY